MTLPAHLSTRDGLPLCVRHWPLPPSQASHGVVILVHGLGEHIGRYDHVASFLNQQGWHVMGHDQRGHGQSPGARGVLRQGDDFLHDLAAVVDAAEALYPGRKRVLLGHSLGGAIAARFVCALSGAAPAATWSRPVDGLVLSSPALSIPISALQKALLTTVGRLTPDVAVGNGLKAEWVCHNPATVQAYLADPLVHDRVSGRLTSFLLDAGEQVRAQAPHWATPTLVVWGGQDRCVNPQGSQDFVDAAPHAWVSSQPFPHLSHEVFNEIEQAQVLQTVGDWLSRVFGR